MAMKRPKMIKKTQKPGIGKGGVDNEEIGPGGKGRPPAKRSPNAAAAGKR